MNIKAESQQECIDINCKNRWSLLRLGYFPKAIAATTCCYCILVLPGEELKIHHNTHVLIKNKLKT